MLILQPELVRRVEEDLLNISAGGTAENIDILPFTCLGFYFYCFLLFLLMVRVSTVRECCLKMVHHFT